MTAYSKLCNVVFSVLKWIVAVVMVFVVLLTFVEVIRRYFFHQNWVWSEVLAHYLIVWCTFLGGAAAYRVGVLTNSWQPRSWGKSPVWCWRPSAPSSSCC